MREIKFRAWDKVCNGYVKDAWKLWLNGGVSICERWTTNDIILEQYTGLKDKNGKEIYEGDIIGWDYYCENEHIVESSIIIWDEKKASFDFQDYNRPDFCRRKIIGNIHENPELLK